MITRFSHWRCFGGRTSRSTSLPSSSIVFCSLDFSLVPNCSWNRHSRFLGGSISETSYLIYNLGDKKFCPVQCLKVFQRDLLPVSWKYSRFTKIDLVVRFSSCFGMVLNVPLILPPNMLKFDCLWLVEL